jgi:hypothetical protein
MRRARALWAFAVDFVVGDDWRLAVGAVAALGAVALASAVGIDAWWLAPGLVAASLALSVAGARRGGADGARPRPPDGG